MGRVKSNPRKLTAQPPDYPSDVAESTKKRENVQELNGSNNKKKRKKGPRHVEKISEINAPWRHEAETPQTNGLDLMVLESLSALPCSVCTELRSLRSKNESVLISFSNELNSEPSNGVSYHKEPSSSELSTKSLSTWQWKVLNTHIDFGMVTSKNGTTQSSGLEAMDVKTDQTNNESPSVSDGIEDQQGTDLGRIILDLYETKAIALDFHLDDDDRCQMNIRMIRIWPIAQHPSDIRGRRQGLDLKIQRIALLKMCTNIQSSVLQPEAVHREVFFDTLAKEMNNRKEPLNVRVASFNEADLGLCCSLRPYQKRCITWMLDKETKNTQQEKSQLHPLWIKVQSVAGSTFYMHRYTYEISAKPFFKIPMDFPGGILADEMGLGKSVEILSLILAHPRKLSEFSSNVNALHSQSATTDEFLCLCGGQASEELNELCCVICGRVQHQQCTGFISAVQSFICTECDYMGPNIDAKTTLIISPDMILQQWIDEFDRHIEGGTPVNVCCYQGIRSGEYTRASTLAGYDVVVTSYQVLQSELDHANIQTEGRSFRNQKRYLPARSPLTKLNWWRICLDEAQMVEGSTTKAAQMALRLKCQNRWCVTGTPIGRGLDDLYGLVNFLALDPYCHQKWFSLCIRDASHFVNTKDDDQPHQQSMISHMLQDLVGVTWRNTKESIADELQLPKQHILCENIKLDAVGRYFYNSLHEECSNHARRIINKHCRDNEDCLLSSLDRQTFKKVMAPLEKLRKACCHPCLALKDAISATASVAPKLKNMTDVTIQLVAKAKLKCTDTFRQMSLATNGLASLHVLDDNIDDAIELYRGFINESKSLQKDFSVDKLQLIHAIHNLAALLTGRLKAKQAISNDMETPADDIIHEIASLEKEENLETSGQVAAAQAVVADRIKDCEKIALLLHQYDASAEGVQLVSSLSNSAGFEEGPFLSSLHNKEGVEITFSSMQGMTFHILQEFERIQDARGQLMSLLEKLRPSPSPAVVRRQADCPQCRTLFETNGRKDDQKHRKVCEFCNATDLFIIYEPLVFSHSTITRGNQASIGEDEEQSEAGNRELTELGGKYFYLNKTTHKDNISKRGASRFEVMMTYVVQEYRRRGLDAKKASEFLTSFAHLKKDFLALRALWKALYERVSILDELAMCTRRIEVRSEDQVVSQSERFAFILRHEIPQRKLEYESDIILLRGDLDRERGRLTYVKVLEQRAKEPNAQVHCPICWSDMTSNYVVLVCGHCLCLECVKRVSGNTTKNRSIKCATCRTLSPIQNVEYVSLAVSSENAIENDECDVQRNESSEIEVRGDHSAKVQAIIRTLLMIKRDHVLSKSVVFSQWKAVLDLLKIACAENDIQVLQLYDISKHKIQVNLARFKANPAFGVLLIPTKSGANGLNLIEATHVLLAEPIVNPETELQAVDRVHRIGQTQETFVHHFVSTNTVEDNIRAQQAEFRKKAKIQTHDSKGSLIDPTQSPTKARNGSEQSSQKGESGLLSLSEFKSLFEKSIGLRAAAKVLGNFNEASSSAIGDNELEKEFWEGKVWFRKSEATREEAERRLAVAASFMTKRNDSEKDSVSENAMISTRTFSLFGRFVVAQIAKTLLELPLVESSTPSSPLLEAMARFKEEAQQHVTNT
eukprot:m.78508 g.78508  ORF g.78508 m.78508 type:complete len:1629 (+) comp12675_c0_seq1:179-5065(+)